jgi:prepilin-type N-terminal cleavage/methylation domain-containing protein
MSCRRRIVRGFTLVELLVVIAIIGVLVSILLPAVNAARDSARRTQNANNLKNIGLAIANYTQAQTRLPALRIIDDETPAAQSVSWAFHILPYLEQQVLHDAFDPSQPCHYPANANAMRIPIEVYANPLQREPLATCRFATDLDTAGSCLDYAANRGFYNTNSDYTRFQQPLIPKISGPFVHNQEVDPAHVRDGKSNTIAVGDRWRGPQDPDYAGLAGASSETIMRGPIGEMQGASFTVQPPFPIGRQDTSTDKFGSAIGQPNATFVFLDGHVQPLDYTIAPLVFKALCTIAGSDPVDPSQL